MNVPRPRALAVAMVVLLAGASGAVASAATMPAEPTDREAFVNTAEAASATVEAISTIDGNGTTIHTAGEDTVLEPAPNQTIRGETTLEPGTDLDVSVEGPSFISTNTVTVTNQRTFNATFDLSTASPETELAISVRKDGTELAEATARVACSDGCESRTTTPENTEAEIFGDGSWVEAMVEVMQNRTASIEVVFGSAEVLTVSVGGPEVNYVVNGTIHDRDGDGRATVLFHTDRAGSDAPTLGVVDDGETRVVEANAETSLDSPLAPASYDVTLYRGPNATDEPDAKGRVVVFESAATDSTVASTDATIVTDGGEPALEPASNQTIRGESTLEPGTDLSLSVEGEDFYMSQVVTVTDRGTFEGTFDFSETARGEELEITLRHNGTTLAETTGEIAPCPGGCETAETVETVRTVEPAATTASDDGLGRSVGGVGMLALGGVLAVAGIGVLLGLFRN